MNSPTFATLIDGTRVAVPDSLQQITPYVLREQEDWFEDEIGFVRRLLAPADRVIDVGANFGVYTMAMAKVVGPSGHVWAFEPASETAAYLAASIAGNDFDQVTLERCALSAVPGTATLSLNENSELNALVQDTLDGVQVERVPVTTLDERFAMLGWTAIEFVKLDAEGEELNILRGGARFFAALSPLVQYEVKAGTALHLDLADAFGQAGYRSYRLVPGPGVLVPFDPLEPVDGYLLNLFCCKDDRAAMLAARGLLVRDLPGYAQSVDDRGQVSRPHAAWQDTLLRFPYAAKLAPDWTRAGGGCAELRHALGLHAVAYDAAQDMTPRVSALSQSYQVLKQLCDERVTQARLMSLARVAREWGMRAVAVKALGRFLNTFFQNRQMEIGEPFLAPGARFDNVPPGPDIGRWMLAAVLEEFERANAFSSFYTGAEALPRLQMIRDLGFGSAEMQRRVELVEARFGSTGVTGKRR